MTGRPPIFVDLKAMEDLIADPQNTMGDVAGLLGVDRNTIYARKDHDNGFKRAYLRGMVRREAACIESNGSKPDDLVLKAIGLGFGTRRELREALGFGYDVIEKCIERNSLELDTQMTGQIERLKLRTALDGDGEIVVAPPTEKNTGVCADCGKPCARGAARCMKCFQANQHPPRNFEVFDATKETCSCGRPANHGGRCWFRRKTTPSLYDELRQQKSKESDEVGAAADTVPSQIVIDSQRAGELCAEGKSYREIADALGVNFYTFNDRRYQDVELRKALNEGHRRYKESKGKPLTALERVTSKITEQEFTEALEKVSAKKPSHIEQFVVKDDRDSFCLNNCDPDTVGHNLKCSWWETEVGRQVKARLDLIVVEKEPDTQRTQLPRTIKRAWSKEFEDDSEEGIPGLTMLYLVSMLHDGMREYEKAAVWTLIQYLKRIEAHRETVDFQKKSVV
jgi:hypothetical protein